tara:strand:+ start:548 stop:1867 length:1320 start_codon:yes stop_codon:yes gene_type:complete
MIIKDLFRNSIRIYLVAFFTSFLGLISQVLIARTYGASSVIDAYLASIAIPVFLTSFITSACSYGLIPRLTEYQNNQEEFIHFTKSILFLGVLVAVFYMFMFFLSPIQAAYYKNFIDIDEQTLLVLFQIGWLIGIAQIFVSINSSILNAKSFYALSTSFASFPYIGIIISLALLNQNQSILNLSYGLLIGTILAVITSSFFLSKELFTKTDNFLINPTKYIIEISNTSIKAVAMASIFTSYMIIDAYWAPRLGDGILATLGYSQRVIGTLGAISIMAIYVITGREAQSELSSKGMSAFRELSKSFIKLSFILSTALAIFLFLFIENIIELLFESKNFKKQDIISLAKTIKFMLPGMICMLVSTILLKLILCLKNSFQFALGLGFCWPALYFSGIFFLNEFALTGIAISYSVAWFVIVLILLINILVRTREKVLNNMTTV